MRFRDLAAEHYLFRHLQNAGHGDPRFEQLRSVSVPREADPEDNLKRNQEDPGGAGQAGETDADRERSPGSRFGAMR